MSKTTIWVCHAGASARASDARAVRVRDGEIVSRLTGISVPIFGISWNPPETERKIARRVIAFLENRRVLYAPFDYEVPGHCIQSVIEMRHFLTTELQGLDSDKEIAQSLRAMRAACRKFLDDDPWHGSPRGYPSPRMLESALGELRGVFGIHIARLADESPDGDSRRRPPSRRPSHDDEW